MESDTRNLFQSFLMSFAGPVLYYCQIDQKISTRLRVYKHLNYRSCCDCLRAKAESVWRGTFPQAGTGSAMDEDTLRCRRQQPSLWRPPRLPVKRLLVIVVVRVRVMVTFRSLVLCVAVPVDVKKNTQNFLFSPDCWFLLLGVSTKAISIMYIEPVHY